ncbi:MAG: T9SS type A sorting domain-containing protein [Ignavibacteriaceae bacterium]
MKKNILSFFLLFISLGSLSAQTFVGKINPYASGEKLNISAQDTLKILAVMVNFQQDRDETTFGNGKFGSIYSVDYGDSIIDPLPHDKDYFEAHLEFVKNYFTKVSNGHLNIAYSVLPDTFSVSKTMRNYSPAGNSDDFTPLAEFSKEVWGIASSMYPDFNFSGYDVFIIFHAGAGRDVTLPGSLGNERDLPSVYLGLKALTNIYGSGFTGFPVAGGFNITNSMIMPETESRELTSLNETFLFELSINGLLAASIASHLGLPDLFDTRTGLSAIGRFGLMDGQAIFAYNGLFPPEPSAWEKIYLGWAEPYTLAPGSYNINLASRLAAAVNDTIILKVPINSSEYYLIENRQRDVGNNGAQITYIINGNAQTRTFLKDTTGFYSYDIDSLNGVITDVDEFDWALPGNGILIWHIDENIINNKIADNTINVDKKNRGVDLEEADGVQDIGETFFNIFGEEVVAEGGQEDMWYAGNESELFTNRFSKDTRPNTNSNAGANSLITISNFSDIADKMSFRVSYGDSIITPIYTTIIDNSGEIKSLSHNPGMSFSIVADSRLMIVTNTETISLNNFTDFKTASFSVNGVMQILGASGNEVKIYTPGQQDVVGIIHLSDIETVSAAPVVRTKSGGEIELLIGTSSGRVLIYSLNPSVVLKDLLKFSDNPIIKVAATPGSIVASTADQVFQDLTGTATTHQEPIRDLVIIEKGDNVTKVVLHKNNKFIIEEPGIVNDFIIQNSDTINSISVADVKNNGNNYILFANGINLEVRNLHGASAENFPFTDPLGIGFAGTPLAADFEGDNKAEIITYTKDGRIFAIDGGTGKVVNGFPISTGAELASVPVLFNYQGQTSLAAVDVKNNFYAWIIGADQGNLIWAEENGNNMNSSFVPAAESTGFINEFFPSAKVYNYPNPVYESATAIRYYVSEDSDINIKIFDLAGDFVAELNDYASGGFDKETTWNVSDVQSGVYFARVEATSVNGKSESNIIKIAVVK